MMVLAPGCLFLYRGLRCSTDPPVCNPFAEAQEAKVRAAWLRFPSFALEPLDQLYRRTGEAAYRYESAGGAFVAELEVNGVGFVTRYPGFWASAIMHWSGNTKLIFLTGEDSDKTV